MGRHASAVASGVIGHHPATALSTVTIDAHQYLLTVPTALACHHSLAHENSTCGHICLGAHVVGRGMAAQPRWIVAKHSAMVLGQITRLVNDHREASDRDLLLRF